MDADRPSFLVVVVDIASLVAYAASRCERDSQCSVPVICGDICTAISHFCSSYALMNRQNNLTVICSGSESATIVYPVGSVGDIGFVPVLHELSRDLPAALRAAIADQLLANTIKVTQTGIGGKSSVAQALSLALTTLNRYREAQGRVLAMQFDRDKPGNYNAIMNSIFSAQKLGVLVDGLVLAPFDSHLLQQACFLTGGVYLRHTDVSDLLQLLLTHFIADSCTRKLLALPAQKSVDFKASCHCHQRPVEFAYMCSVCLTLTCQPSERCEVCHTPARGSAQRAGGGAAR